MKGAEAIAGRDRAIDFAFVEPGPITAKAEAAAGEDIGGGRKVDVKKNRDRVDLRGGGHPIPFDDRVRVNHVRNSMIHLPDRFPKAEDHVIIRRVDVDSFEDSI
jgi:hypothetical protein